MYKVYKYDLTTEGEVASFMDLVRMFGLKSKYLTFTNGRDFMIEHPLNPQRPFYACWSNQER